MMLISGGEDTSVGQAGSDAGCVDCKFMAMLLVQVRGVRKQSSHLR
jgi:hypothetical protein